MAAITRTDEPGPRLPPAWRLSLLGAWQLTGTDRQTGADQQIDVGTNGQRLFAVLALRGRCDRSYLSGVLWPDCSDPHAHGNLRATLSRLHRRNLTDPLESANGVLRLRSDVAVDVSDLVATASAVLDGAAPPDRRVLRTLTADDLLIGWYDDWVLLERERLRQLRLHALEVLSGQLLATGNGPAAVEAALAAVAVEPLRESAHRAVIRAHLAEGNRAEALRQLDQLRHLLRLELGVQPSRLATDLLRRRPAG
jgi:DNA-binding SARP family transcriptional activator